MEELRNKMEAYNKPEERAAYLYYMNYMESESSDEGISKELELDIDTLLDEMGFPKASDIIYDNDGVPLVNWRDLGAPDFDYFSWVDDNWEDF